MARVIEMYGNQKFTDEQIKDLIYQMKEIDEEKKALTEKKRSILREAGCSKETLRYRMKVMGLK